MTRGATPFKGLSPVITGALSLIRPMKAALSASERCGCSASSANTPEDRPQPCECLAVGFQGTPPSSIGRYSGLTR